MRTPIKKKLYNVISGVTLIFPKSYSAWFLIMGIVIALQGCFLFRNIIVFLNWGNQRMRCMVLQLFSSSLYYVLMSYLFVLLQLAANPNWLHWSLSNSLARSVCMWILHLVFSDTVDIKVATWLSTILGIYEKNIAYFQFCFFCTNQYCTPEVTRGWFCSYVPMFGETEYDPIRQFSSVGVEEQLDALGGAVDAGKVSNDNH
jgi:hypothetical protein